MSVTGSGLGPEADARRGAALFGRLAAVALTAVAAVALTAGPALAHASLLDTDPGEGEVVEGPPAEVVLLFDEPMQQPATVDVVGPDGESVADGDAEVHGEQVRLGLGAIEADGEYAVEWRAVSADDHPVSGEFSFEVTGPEGERPDDGPTGTDEGSEKGADEEPADSEGGADAGADSTADAGARDDEPASALAGDEAASSGGGVLAVLLVGAVVLALLGGGAAFLAGRRGSAG